MRTRKWWVYNVPFDLDEFIRYCQTLRKTLPENSSSPKFEELRTGAYNHHMLVSCVTPETAEEAKIRLDKEHELALSREHAEREELARLKAKYEKKGGVG